MIDRYAREEMSAVWSAENRYNKWLEIEILVCEALAQRGEIPFPALEIIKAKAGFDVGRIDEIEKTTKHDVIAFLTDVSQRVGEDGRFLHLGLTSSDILDTSLALLLREAADILLADLERLLAALKKKGISIPQYHHDWQNPRHSCRTYYLRIKDGALVSGDDKKQTPTLTGPRNDQRWQDIRRRGHLFLC